MAQFSVKIIRLNGAVLDENQHGVIRDVIVAKETIGASAATPYTSVFALEAGLLTLGLLLALPLRGKTGLRKTTLEAAEISYPTGVKDAQTAASPLVEGRAG
jgi:hypothetical protein